MGKKKFELALGVHKKGLLCLMDYSRGCGQGRDCHWEANATDHFEVTICDFQEYQALDIQLAIG